MILSIIIPAYNSEIYLEKCIGSILSQNIDDNLYEIIIINDGSDDATLSIALEFAKKTKNLKVISQSNQGQSFSRNRGLQQASGTYVWCVDSDDLIAEGSLQYIIDTLISTDLDVLHIGWDRFDEKGNRMERLVGQKSRYTESVLSGTDFLYSLDYYLYAWVFIYRREFLIRNKCEYAMGIKLYEDLIFNIEAISQARKCKFLNYTVYKYMQYASSILHTVSKRQIEDIDYVVGYLISICEKHPELKTRIEAFVSLQIFGAVVRLRDYPDELKRMLVLIRKYGISRLALPKKYAVFQWIYNYISPTSFCKFIKIVSR